MYHNNSGRNFFFPSTSSHAISCYPSIIHMAWVPINVVNCFYTRSEYTYTMAYINNDAFTRCPLSGNKKKEGKQNPENSSEIWFYAIFCVPMHVAVACHFIPPGKKTDKKRNKRFSMGHFDIKRMTSSLSYFDY